MLADAYSIIIKPDNCKINQVTIGATYLVASIVGGSISQRKMKLALA